MYNPFTPPQVTSENLDEGTLCPACNATNSRLRFTIPFAPTRCRVCGARLYLHLEKDRTNLLVLLNLGLFLPLGIDYFLPQLEVPNWLIITFPIIYLQILNTWIWSRFGVIKFRDTDKADSV
ncbi:MAG: hypothetical protein U0930_10895 [Pirellulales bacterium]